MSDKTDLIELKRFFEDLPEWERGNFLVSEHCPNCGGNLNSLSRTDVGFCVYCVGGCGLRTLDANTPERALELWIRAKEKHGKDCRVLASKTKTDKPDFSMDKIISEVEAAIAKGKAQKADTTNPSHYSRWKIEPLDFIMANNLDFLRGNIIKYIMRYDAKGGIDDLKKARVYLDKLIEKVERKNG